MPEVLLIRHAQALANKGDFVTFDNKESPLTDHGLAQCQTLHSTIKNDYGIDSSQYDGVVVASEFVRPQQTAKATGFAKVDISPLLNEPDFSRGLLTGPEIVAKHRNERWAPDEARVQARKLINVIVNGEFPYYFAFTHGMFTATVLLELEDVGHDMSDYIFDDKRGYVPLQTGIVQLKL